MRVNGTWSFRLFPSVLNDYVRDARSPWFLITEAVRKHRLTPLLGTAREKPTGHSPLHVRRTAVGDPARYRALPRLQPRRLVRFHPRRALADRLRGQGLVRQKPTAEGG